MALNLTKGATLNLIKQDGNRLTHFCVGLNWGAIQKRSFWGNTSEAVDLDGSVALFSADNRCSETVFYRQLRSSDGAVRHSGDDLVGDIKKDDKLDNELITIDLLKLNPAISKIVFILNSYKGQDFATIPYAHIRLYEGTKQRMGASFAEFNVAADPKFSGYVSMIMGKLTKERGEWQFTALGEPTTDRTLHETLITAQKFL